MSPALIRLAIMAAVATGLYGAGYLRATLRFHSVAEVARLTAERDVARQELQTLQSASADAEARAAALDATNQDLAKRVQSYEQTIIRPSPASACALDAAGAERLRAIR